MTENDLRPELRTPEVHGVAVAFLDMVSWRSRLVARMRAQTGARGLTLLDLNILLQVFTFGLAGGAGTSPQEIVNNFRAARRTVRDALGLLEGLGLIVREDDGLYYPTAEAARMYNETFEERFRLIVKVCETFPDYRRSIGR
jgi:hypothetical protein